LVSGFIMDRIGRIKTIVANECVILGIFCMFQIPNITVLCINFGLTGLTAGVLLHTSIVINLELVPKSISPMSGIFFVIFYCIAKWAEE
jgi:MFS family permease